MEIAQRHIAQAGLPQITKSGQETIYAAKVLIVGVGALGSATAELLCRAGVRDLTLYDYDIVDETNLQRQSLYTSLDLGKFKVEAAKERLLEIDPQCIIKIVPEAFSPGARVRDYDLVIDGTDSLQARMLLNDIAKRDGIPLIIGAAAGVHGMVFASAAAICWQCVSIGKQAEDDCASGVLGSTIYTVASMQAAAAIKTLLGEIPKDLVEIDTWSMQVRRIGVQRNPQCAACKGEYKYAGAPFSMRFCSTRDRLIGMPNIPSSIDMEQLKSSYPVMKDYGSATVIALGEGTVLVHKHGAMEFSNVPEDEAKRFAQEILE